MLGALGYSYLSKVLNLDTVLDIWNRKTLYYSDNGSKGDLSHALKIFSGILILCQLDTSHVLTYIFL